jgi:hypothetical protein
MSKPKIFAGPESDIDSLIEFSHTARNHSHVSLPHSEVSDSKNERLSSTDHIDTFAQARRIAPAVNVESNDWSALSEWNSSSPTGSPPPPPPPASPSASSAVPFRSVCHAPIEYIRGATRKKSYGGLVKSKEQIKRRNVLWHSNRTKPAQAQRLTAQRKEAERERDKKDVEDKKRNFFERVEGLQRDSSHMMCLIDGSCEESVPNVTVVATDRASLPREP